MINEVHNPIWTVEDILNGKADIAKDFKFNNHGALIERFKSFQNGESPFVNKLSQECLNNVAEYFMRLPSPLALDFYQNVMVGNRNTHSNASNLCRILFLDVEGTRVQERIMSHIIDRQKKIE